MVKGTIDINEEMQFLFQYSKYRHISLTLYITYSKYKRPELHIGSDIFAIRIY